MKFLLTLGFLPYLLLVSSTSIWSSEESSRITFLQSITLVIRTKGMRDHDVDSSRYVNLLSPWHDDKLFLFLIRFILTPVWQKRFANTSNQTRQQQGTRKKESNTIVASTRKSARKPHLFGESAMLCVSSTTMEVCRSISIVQIGRHSPVASFSPSLRFCPPQQFGRSERSPISGKDTFVSHPGLTPVYMLRLRILIFLAVTPCLAFTPGGLMGPLTRKGVENSQSLRMGSYKSSVSHTNPGILVCNVHSLVLIASKDFIRMHIQRNTLRFDMQEK
jgi:hypothetical protein